MSSEQTRRTLNQIDNEIASLEHKSADLGKKEANARSNAARTMKSISNNASASILHSKQLQINRYNDEAIKAANDKAENDKKIADKRKKRADTMVKLQNEEAIERKKYENAQKTIQQQYERRIKNLTSQLSQDLILYSSILKVEKNDSDIKDNNEEYDVFISYASEDKETFVDDLVKELKKDGIKVWYDEINIGWGDSLRTKIDLGLAKSKYGIAVLSRDYIRKYWTKQELEGLFQQETPARKVILPLWHNITRDEVNAFSPILAARKALNTALLSTKEIANEFSNLFLDIKKHDLEKNTEISRNDR
jgi:hypothetical protein